MTVETDGKGSVLAHIERFVCGDDGTVEEKKFFDYAIACEWRRHMIQMLDDAGCAYTHEADSEWVPEDGGWTVIGSTADSGRTVGEVIQHQVYAVGYYTKDVNPRILGGIAGIRSAALDLADTDIEEIARFTSLGEARNFLATKKNSMRTFGAGMMWYSADVYWLYAIIIDEDGGEEIGEFIDAAGWESES